MGIAARARSHLALFLQSHKFWSPSPFFSLRFLSLFYDLATLGGCLYNTAAPEQA